MDARVGQDSSTELLTAVSTRRRHGRARRPLRSGSRRPAVLLSALLAGGVAASVFGLTGPSVASAGGMSVMESLATTDEADLLPQASVTVAEAQARLTEVAASRAARAEAEAATREAARPKFVMPINGARYTSCFCARWGVFHY